MVFGPSSQSCCLVAFCARNLRHVAMSHLYATWQCRICHSCVTGAHCQHCTTWFFFLQGVYDAYKQSIVLSSEHANRSSSWAVVRANQAYDDAVEQLVLQSNGEPAINSSGDNASGSESVFCQCSVEHFARRLTGYENAAFNDWWGRTDFAAIRMNEGGCDRQLWFLWAWIRLVDCYCTQRHLRMKRKLLRLLTLELPSMGYQWQRPRALRRLPTPPPPPLPSESAYQFQ